MTTGLPFDDFRSLLANLGPVDGNAAETARENFRQTGGDRGSPTTIEGVAAWLAGSSGRAHPSVNRPVLAVFAGNHGIAGEGVSPRPPSATADEVELCASGGAAINRLCAAGDLGLKVLDLALDLPTGDISHEAAFDERTAAATMAFGMEVIAGGVDLLGIGDFGVANSTVAAAIAAALFGGKGADWAGAGSGADKTMIMHKAAVIDRALACHTGHFRDPLEVLRRLGGREFAAIAGAVLAARMERIPVILDGYAAMAAAAVLHAANPDALDHCRLAAVPVEPPQAKLASLLGLAPVLAFDAGGSGGAGAAIAMMAVRNVALCRRGGN
ncbi:MAG: nicotinate-nucleotide--dimethylbenzimidazole phosphoribosyltransferase [Rhizobiaceae bacterium]|nr:MAG: nicotinate-nucleotide--dimethylbenzimidazole phosphoribosyltransferase [Rhizobiaceae bacterium]